MKGGDTDTNAAIVCGLIGAAVGLSGLPQEMVGKVMTFDSKEGAHHRVQTRPDYLIPKRHLWRMMKQIYQEAPAELTVQCGTKLITDKEEIKKLAEHPEEAY